MKKRLLAMALVLLAAVLLPLALHTDALAANDQLYLGGTAIDVAKNSSGTGKTGTWSYDAAEKTLTLDGYSCDGNSYYGQIDSGTTYKHGAYLYTTMEELTIVLKGENTFGSSSNLNYLKDSSTTRTCGIYANNSGAGKNRIVLKNGGSGSLNIQVHERALQVKSLVIESGQYNFTSYGWGSVCGTFTITGGEATILSQGNNLDYTGLVVTDNLVMYSGTRLDVTSNGCSYQSYYPVGLRVDGTASLQGTLNVTCGGSNKDDGSNGTALKCGKLEVLSDGSVSAVSQGSGKSGNTGRYAVDVTRELYVSIAGRLTASTNNAENYPAVRAGSYRLTSTSGDNLTATVSVITAPANAVVKNSSGEANKGSVYESDGKTYASDVSITGLFYAPLYLNTNNGKTTWSYSVSGGTEYTGSLNLLEALGPTAVSALPEIIVQSGSHTVKLSGVRMHTTGSAITLRSTTTLTLQLAGENILSGGGSKGGAVIRLPESGNLIIEDDPSDQTIGSLAIEASGNYAGIGGTSGDGSVTINSGAVVVTAEKGAAIGGAATATLSTNAYNGTNVIINGGVVMASSTSSAAIGGGYAAQPTSSGGNGGTLTMTGGTVSASSKNGVAIGGGGSKYRDGGDGGKVVISGGSLDARDDDGNMSIGGGKGKTKDGSAASITNASGTPVYQTVLQLQGILDTDTPEVYKYSYLFELNTSSGSSTYGKRTYTLPALSSFGVSLTTSGSAKVYNYGTNDIIGNSFVAFLPENAYSYSAKVRGINEEFKPNFGTTIQTNNQNTTAGRLCRTAPELTECFGILALRQTGAGVLQYCLGYDMNIAEDLQPWIDYSSSAGEALTRISLTSSSEQTSSGILVLSGTHTVILDGVKLTSASYAPVQVMQGSLILQLPDDPSVENVLKNSAEQGSVIELGANGSASLTLTGSGILSLESTGAGSTGIGSTGIGETAVSIASGRLNISAAQTGMDADTIQISGGTLNFADTAKTLADSAKITITGGSVPAQVASTVTGIGSKAVHMVQYTITGIDAVTKVDQLTFAPADYNYGITDIYTDAQGHISLWLPEATHVQSVTIGEDSYYTSGGGTTLDLPAPPQITAPTENSEVFGLVGNTVTLSVTASGIPDVTYQWQKKSGDTWTNIEGANSADYAITIEAEAQEGEVYRCVAENFMGTAISSEFTLHVLYPARITSQPEDTDALVGGKGKFTVQAEGNPEVTYQWQVDRGDGQGFTDITGATAAVYLAPATGLEMDGWKYRCAVQNNVGLNGEDDIRTVYSNAAVLHVEEGYVIIESSLPSELLPTLPMGGQATFTIQTNIKDPTYTWYIMKSAGTDTYVLDGVVGGSELTFTFEDYGVYKVWCVVSGDPETSITMTSDIRRVRTFIPGSGAQDDDPIVTPDPAELSFQDVKPGDWFYEDVKYVYEKNLMTGTAADTFAPGLTVTRGMITTILYRLAGEPAVSGSCPFPDVKAGSYYEKAITWAAANDIVKGYSSDSFGPDDTITREQMAAILYRYAGFKGIDVSARADLTVFPDSADISVWAQDALSWANAEKLVNGMEDGRLSPRGSASRAQAAAILHRFCENIVK